MKWIITLNCGEFLPLFENRERGITAIMCLGSRPDYLCEVLQDFKTHKSKSWPFWNMSLNNSRGCSINTKYQKLPVKHIQTQQILVINYSF